MRLLYIFFTLFIGLISSLSCAYAGADIPDKTPSDVYRQALNLADRVRLLRQNHNVAAEWPEVTVESRKAPRHVLQKSNEVLQKVNRLRENLGLGSITVPAYPSRYVTPNEVYERVRRLVAEIDLLLPPEQRMTVTDSANHSFKTPTDVYQKLWEISRALDPVLGIRGFSPSDVFSQAHHVTELVRFLRLSQNLPDNVPLPARPLNKHPNHALQSAYRLQARIAQAEHNLWMKPDEVPEVPRRVITPTDVYDALQNVIAELQRVKYRLGVEREFEYLPTDRTKTPNDVVQYLDWATAMMPDFSMQRVLVQYPSTSIAKHPADVFRVADRIYQSLSRYQAMRGIRLRPQKVPLVAGLQPRHVYQKTLETMGKVHRLRVLSGLGESVMPVYPLRPITPTEVYEQVRRLEEELNLIYRHSGLDRLVTRPQLDGFDSAADSITPSMVYQRMWDVSNLLDTVLGSTGYGSDDLYTEARITVLHIQQVMQYLGRWQSMPDPDVAAGVTHADAQHTAMLLVDKLAQVQRRAGLYGNSIPIPRVQGNAGADDLFNSLGMINAELVNLKLHLGITQEMLPPQAKSGMTMGEVGQQVEIGVMLLSELLQENKR